MSDAVDGLPATTARAITIAALVGTLALAGYDRAVLGGIGIGLAFAAVSRWFAGPHRRVAVAAALLPVIVIGAVAGLARTLDPTSGALVVVASVTAAAAGATATGWPSSTAVRRIGTAAIIAAAVAAILAVLGHGIDTAGGIGPAAETVLWLPGSGISGVLVWIVAAGLALAVGSVALPSAAFTTPRYADSSIAMRNTLALTVVFAAGLAFVSLSVGTLFARYVFSMESLIAGVAGSGVARGLLAAVALFGVTLTALGLVVGYVWNLVADGSGAIVAVAVGTVFGTTGAFVGTVGAVAPGGQDDLVAPLFGAIAVVLGAGWLAMKHGTRLIAATPDPATVIAVGLAAGSVTVGTTSDAADVTVFGTVLPSLVALAAGLFVYDVGRYGRTLGREIGLEGASRRPQLVRVGWSGAVAAVGVPIAAGGLWIGTVLAPALSVPATAGVVAGVTAVVGGAWLLLR
ncbi:hypothetical protein GS429_16620 [Natronorubrum sp. JWXQ-INN-674]|uniref:Uncharacterized protein n=1 Tax=Natronorubrum halalkaliphilum TaxID=2691917 RepID=A0A6B0VR40_9EURY|nr:hypothetical protein [Natronorubrum halalkaliphilum]MXV63653.1 hypothetical protein [Natronorubrum halalkaliphilum]